MALKKYMVNDLAVGESVLIEIIEKDDGSGITNEANIRQAVVRHRKKTGQNLVTHKTPAGLYVTRLASS